MRLSADGRYVAFTSAASNLVPNDTNGYFNDVFVRDRQNGAVDHISVSTSGGSASLGVFAEVEMSADARFVVFVSGSANLVAGDANSSSDVFLRDRLSGTTELVSLSSTGAQGNDLSVDATMSDDGSRIAFTSYASNLVAGDTNGIADVFLRDRTAGTTQRISVSTFGAQSLVASQYAVLSGDGRFVAFAGWDDLVVGDSNSAYDVLVRDLLTGTLEIASVSSGGALGDLPSLPGDLSFDGRYVTFQSSATNLAAGDNNAAVDVFLRDRVLGTTEIVSLAASGALGHQGAQQSVISADGRWIAFESFASNLVAGDTNGSMDIFLRDRLTATTQRASVGPLGEQSNEHSSLGDVSADGRCVAFWTFGEVVPGDINVANDVHVRDLGYVGASPANYCTTKVNSAGCAPRIAAMGQALVSGYDSFFLGGHNVLAQKNGLFFWGHTPTALPFGGGTLCVQPPLVRTPIQSSGGNLGCTGSFWFHFSQAYMASESVVAGDTLYGQFWYRDSGFLPPNNIGLTDAVQWTLAP
ncbi:MAG: PD40 domain-containing protein [Planctomycetes bacterium]|nr:PD40 domain-containing protein [Planctomycetota bacterium]